MNEDTKASITAHGNAYSHTIIGILKDGCLHSCGFKFVDDAFRSDYIYLDGKIISIDVNRIDVSFED